MHTCTHTCKCILGALIQGIYRAFHAYGRRNKYLQPQIKGTKLPWLSSLWALGRVTWDRVKAAQRLLHVSTWSWIFLRSTFSDPQSLQPNVTTLALSHSRPEYSQLRAYRDLMDRGWITTSWWLNFLVESVAIHATCESVASLRTIGIRCSI